MQLNIHDDTNAAEQWCAAFLTAGHSGTSDSVQCHKWFLKHTISILIHQLLFISFILVLY